MGLSIIADSRPVSDRMISLSGLATNMFFKIQTQHLHSLKWLHLLLKLSNICDYIIDAILLTTYLWILYIWHSKWSQIWKVVNCRVVDLVDYYNFDVDFIFIQHCQPSQIRPGNLYWIFKHINHFKLKSYQLQSFIYLFELYCFSIKFVLIWLHMKKNYESFCAKQVKTYVYHRFMATTNSDM
jgi:hypothetical protein